MSKEQVDTPEDANNRLVLCGCTVWCELEMSGASNGDVRFSGVCEGCDRHMTLTVQAAP
jgi:2C-methyl-D-erythritol 2,4-cyclodiphosphate synthase